MVEGAVQLDELLQRGFRYALSLAHDRSRAEDLVQDACLRIARRGGPWTVKYMIPVIRNVFIDEYRRHQKVRFENLEGPARGVAATAAPAEGFDDELEGALGTLRPQVRELLHLSIVEGYTASEIAELTDQPRGTVLSTVHRAKRKLRRILGGEKAVS